MDTDIDFRAESTLTFIAQVSMAILGIITLTAIARLRGVDVVGTYYFGLTIAILVVRVTAGIAGAIKKRISEYGSNPAEYFTFGILAHSAFVIVLSGGTAFLYAIVGEHLPPIQFAVGVLLVASALGYFELGMGAVAGTGYPGRSSWLDAGRSIARVLIHFPLLFAGANAPELLAGTAAATTLFAVVAAREVGHGFTIPTKQTVGNVVSFAKWTIPNSYVSDMYQKYDIIVLGILGTVAAVGYYESAVRIAMPALFVSSSVSQALIVQSSYQESRGVDPTENMVKALNVAGIIAIPLFFGALVVGKTLLPQLFGPEYREPVAYLALAGVTGFHIIAAYNHLFKSFFTGIDKPGIAFRAQASGLFVNVPLSVALVLRYGVAGVIVGTTVVEMLILAQFQYSYRALFGEFLIPRESLTQLLCGAVMAGSVYALSTIIGTGTLLALGSLIAFGAFVYTVLLLLASSSMRSLAVGVLDDFGLITWMTR